MSLLFMDSFKNYTFLPLKWDSYTQYCQFYITDGIGRKGGQALRVYSDYTVTTYDHLGKYLESNQEEIILGFAFKKIKYDIGWIEVDFNDGDSVQSKVKLFNTSFVWYKGDESTNYGINSSLNFDDWNYFEAKIRTHTTSGTVDIRVNEHLLLSESDIDTTTTANNYIDNIRFRLKHYADTNEDYAYIEDLYIANTSGTTNNDFLGNCEIAVIYPQAIGTHSEFDLAPTYSGVANYTLIDEQVHQEDTTATYSNTFLQQSGLDDGSDIYYGGTPTFNNTATNTTDSKDMYIDPAGAYGPSYQWFRFHGVTIPKNATITSAYLDVYRHEYFNLTQPTLNEQKVYAEYKGTAPADVTALGQIQNRSATYATTITDIGTHLNGLDIANVIQDLVYRHDWQEVDNSVMIISRYRYTDFDENGCRINYRTYEYRNDPYHSDSPKLFVEWSLPGGDNDEYVTTSGIDTRDTYNVNTVSGISNIFAINHNIFSKRHFDLINDNDLYLIPLAVVSGTTYSGTALVPPDTVYKCLNYIEEKNPYTNDTWLLTDMATNEFGFTTTSG